MTTPFYKVCNICMSKFYLALLRISIGSIFLWAFFDKFLGLGFATVVGKAWIMGGSPTMGYLKNATHGPFAEIFKSMAGNPIVDVLFMFGLFGVGIAFVLGIALRFAAICGALMMALMYMSAFPPANNPLIDDHVIYAIVLLVLAELKSGDTLGFGKMWSKGTIANSFPILR